MDTLEYAAGYLPNHVESLLRRGEDATVGCPLAIAADWGSISIIKPLVEAGARVNAYHTRLGLTALHIVCHNMDNVAFKALIQHTGEDAIDWNARTLDVKGPLQLADASFAEYGYRSTVDLQELFDILRAHVFERCEELHDGDEPFWMPGGTATAAS
ncbi:hypothetical protein BC835DRAFT_488992 [Cytidiella melzeri]|nr:hypothetical protein BC835DRAFT_488992 [Cytidiella melzeri]